MESSVLKDIRKFGLVQLKNITCDIEICVRFSQFSFEEVNEITAVRYFKVSWTAFALNDKFSTSDAECQKDVFFCQHLAFRAILFPKREGVLVSGNVTKQEWHLKLNLWGRVFAEKLQLCWAFLKMV